MPGQGDPPPLTTPDMPPPASSCLSTLLRHGLGPSEAALACSELDCPSRPIPWANPSTAWRGPSPFDFSSSRRLSDDGTVDGMDGFAKFDEESDYVNAALVLLCVMTAALAAGLTMGLVSLEPFDLRYKERSGSPEEQRLAKRLLPLVTNRPHHQVGRRVCSRGRVGGLCPRFGAWADEHPPLHHPRCWSPCCFATPSRMR